MRRLQNWIWCCTASCTVFLRLKLYRIVVALQQLKNRYKTRVKKKEKINDNKKLNKKEKRQ
jgi:hypothetical protein